MKRTDACRIARNTPGKYVYSIFGHVLTLVMHFSDIYSHYFSVLDINMAYVDQIVENTLHKIAQTVEQQLDDELERLDKLDVSDLEKLREERLKALQKEAEQQKEWRFLVRNL
jgi:hypothetical protein